METVPDTHISAEKCQKCHDDLDTRRPLVHSPDGIFTFSSFFLLLVLHGRPGPPLNYRKRIPGRAHLSPCLRCEHTHIRNNEKKEGK